MKLLFILCIYLLHASCISGDDNKRYQAIHSGVSWFDQNNKEVNAHGACIVREGDVYYLFGEYKSDTTNAFSGFSCYSSTDLMNWRFERVVLPVQTEGLLGPSRVGERVKVMKCPLTNEFIMYMHTDDMRYADPHVGYATCSTINGNYQFQGALMNHGEVLRKWDLGTFQDSDGKGYLLTHEGFIYELSGDYKTVSCTIASDEAHGGESPAMFKKEGVYFWLFSNKTSWERNDNYYLTATSLKGPWNRRGYFAPEGSLTWNSQCSFVFPVVNGNDTLHMYMGDRWSFPKQGSAATQVWLPISVKRDEMSIPEFYTSWRIDTSVEDCWRPLEIKMKPIKDKSIVAKGNWEMDGNIRRSKKQGAMLSYRFEGKQVAIKALVNAVSGYSKVILYNDKEEEVIHTLVDFYSNYECISQTFLSPLLEYGRYALTIEVLGEYPKWSDKRRNDYGSKDSFIHIESVSYR